MSCYVIIIIVILYGRSTGVKFFDMLRFIAWPTMQRTNVGRCNSINPGVVIEATAMPQPKFVWTHNLDSACEKLSFRIHVYVAQRNWTIAKVIALFFI